MPTGSKAIALCAAFLLSPAVAVFAHDGHSHRGGRPAFGPGTASLPKAIEFFEKRADSNGEDVLSRIKLGQLYLKAAQDGHDHDAVKSAFDRLHEARALSPNNAEIETTLAHACMAIHQFDRAIQMVQGVLEQDSNNAVALAILGDACFESGKYHRAFAIYEQLAKQSSGPAVLARLAKIDELRGDLLSARERLTQAIVLLETRDHTTHASAWYLARRGDLALQQGEIDEARRDFELSLARDRNWNALLGMARVAASQGDLATGVKWCRQSLQTSPSLDAKLFLIQLYQSKGRSKSEARLVESVLSEQESHTHENGGQHVLDQNQQAEMTTLHYRQIAELMLDQLIDVSGALELARSEWERRRDIKTAEILAWAYFNNGRLDEAERIADEATRWGTRDPILLFRTAVIYDAVGDSHRAKASLERLIAGYPRVLVGSIARIDALCERYDLEWDAPPNGNAPRATS